MKCDAKKPDIKESENTILEVKTCSQEEQEEIDKHKLQKTDNSSPTPVAPPRRKKKNKKQPDKTQVNIIPEEL